MNIQRIEPPCWWIGMKTPLQLMIYGKDLAGGEVQTDTKGITIREVHPAESPNYLFVDIEISPELTPGEYLFTTHKGTEKAGFTYRIEKRRKNAASRTSYTSADMVYLLMPDRFANGDPSIDNTPDTTEKIDRTDPSGRHGGDLQGIIDHLDYLVDLGVTTLWLTPPQEDNQPKSSYHGYGCTDYYRIDPRFGSNELYKQLVREAHEKGLKVIMDAVPNHCGSAHWWMKDLPFRNWVHLHSGVVTSNYRLAVVTDPNRSQLNKEQTVNGWFDKAMPDMALENPYVLRYFLQLYIWWIEWTDLDGLRVDTLPYNEKYAAARWTKGLLEEYPELSIVAECWHSSPAIVAYWQGNKPKQDGYASYLPSVMDFPLQEALKEGLETDSDGWMEGMNRLYEALALDFVYQDPLKLMIFLDNHDIERFADSMRGDIAKIKLGITLLATLRGIPQLYYGTEFGFRSTDLSKGDGAARIDFPGGWKGDRKNLFTGLRMNKKEREIFEHTRKLFNWRKHAGAIHEGKTTHFLPENNTYAFFRYTDKESVFVFLNPSKKDVKVKWEKFNECLEGYTSALNILTGRKVSLDRGFTVKARESMVIELKA